MACYNVTIKEDQKQRIIDNLLLRRDDYNWPINPRFLIDEFKDYARIYREGGAIFESWIPDIEARAPIVQINHLAKAYRAFKKKGNYSDFEIGLISLEKPDSWFIGSEEFHRLFVENGFFLPRFDKEYPHQLSSLCFSIAKLAGIYGVVEDFSALLNERVRISNNDIVKDRADYLLEYAERFSKTSSLRKR